MLTFVVLRVLLHKDFHATPLRHSRVVVSEPALARLAR